MCPRSVHNVVSFCNASRLCVWSPTLQGSSIHQDNEYNFGVLFSLAFFLWISLFGFIDLRPSFPNSLWAWLSSLGFALDGWNINTRQFPWSGHMLQAWMCLLPLPLKGLSPFLASFLSNLFSFTFTLFGLCPWFLTWLHASTHRTIHYKDLNTQQYHSYRATSPLNAQDQCPYANSIHIPSKRSKATDVLIDQNANPSTTPWVAQVILTNQTMCIPEHKTCGPSLTNLQGIVHTCA